MDNLFVSLIQSDIYFEDKERNINAFDQKIDSIKEPTDLIVLPEVFNTGFDNDPEKATEEMEGRTMEWMAEKSALKDAVVCGSLPIVEDGNFYNRLIWMKADGNYEYYDKRHLFRISKEYQTYTRGNKRLIVEYKGWKILPQICFDLRFPVWNRNVEEYDLAIYVSNWPEVRSFAWKSLLPARAIENQCYVVGVNRVGEGKRGEYHSGDSMVVDPKGQEIFSVSHIELVQTIKLEKHRITKTREELPFLEERERFKFME